MQDKRLYVRRASAGSGKTYTLAAHYIALLLHGQSYRSILAVTFTNKATAEMKERILSYLYAIARETHLGATQAFLGRVRELSTELGFDSSRLSDNYCKTEAERIFRQILSDYDVMRVSTIDAFLQTLLSGMVQMLDGAVGYAVELDTQSVISEAADKLLTEGAQVAAVKTQLVEYMNACLDDEKHWDVRSGLIAIAKQLYSELLQEHEDELVTDAVKLHDLKTLMAWRDNAPLDALRSQLDRMKRFSEADFKNASWFLGRIELYEKQLDGPIEKMDDAFPPFSETVQKALDDVDEFAKKYKHSDVDAARQEFCRLRELASQCRRAYLREALYCQHLNDLILMEHLRRIIEQGLRESNTRLLSVTANTLAKALQPGDADFILEKAGIRYKHIMLDEFQDTSSLQWKNFSLLLKEILSTEEGSTLIVGDIKQSIYRWRNGDWRIMAGLDQSFAGYYNEHVGQLVRNFRSEREVVKFNLELFRTLAQAESDERVPAIYNEGYDGSNLSDYYRKGHEGGYVRLHRYDKSTGSAADRYEQKCGMVRDMFQEIELLLQQGVSPCDMLILLRINKEAKIVMQVLEEMQQEEEHASLRGLRLISNDSFLLEYSRSVRTIVAAMRYLYRHDEIARLYLEMVCPDAHLQELREYALRRLSLIDLTEAVVQRYLTKDGLFTGTDLSYLNAFKDKLRKWVMSNGSDGDLFISYWEEKMSGSAIPATEQYGIRLMSIHTSKGLEAKNVFLPFCDWKMEEDKQKSKLWCHVPELRTSDKRLAILPIHQGKQMAEAGFDAEYQQEHALQRIDNLNLLYVAFTRAAERLYIFIDVADSKKDRKDWDVAQLINWACAQDEYGTPVWEREDAKGGKEKAKEPFSFAEAQEVQAEYYTSESQIRFEQSQDSRKYGWDIVSLPADERPEMDRRAFGTLCHDILSAVRLYPDAASAQEAVGRAVEEAYRRGQIPTEALRDEIAPLLRQTVSHPDILPFFVGEGEVLCEEAVVYANDHGEVEERRMDRVVRRGNSAVVIDYKFGHDDPQYDRQVRHYMAICRKMGYSDVKGYLWIAAEQRLISVEA